MLPEGQGDQNDEELVFEDDEFSGNMLPEGQGDQNDEELVFEDDEFAGTVLPEGQGDQNDEELVLENDEFAGNMLPEGQGDQNDEELVFEDDENDFIIPEDRQINIWQQLFMNDSDDDVRHEIPFVQVPPNLHELYLPQDEEQICVVCRSAQRTHALVPCGHRVLCMDCVAQLEVSRCPICNQNFTLALRIW